TRQNPAGLTARELEVLVLLAEGLRNAQIAERLVVAQKTVDHHVSAILRKLDAPTRGQAAAAPTRLGLLDTRGCPDPTESSTNARPTCPNGTVRIVSTEMWSAPNSSIAGTARVPTDLGPSSSTCTVRESMPIRSRASPSHPATATCASSGRARSRMRSVTSS